MKIDRMAWIGLKWLSLERGDGMGCINKGDFLTS